MLKRLTWTGRTLANALMILAALAMLFTYSQLAAHALDREVPIIQNVESVTLSNNKVVIQADITDNNGRENLTVTNRVVPAYGDYAYGSGMKKQAYASVEGGDSFKQTNKGSRYTFTMVNKPATEKSKLVITAVDKAGNKYTYIVVFTTSAKKYIKMNIGETRTFRGGIIPKNFSYTKDDSEYNNGKVRVENNRLKALKAGKATLVYKNDKTGKYYAVEVIVKDPYAAPKGDVTILNTIANSAKKTNDVIWNKSDVSGATNYEINWKARGADKWASVTVGNTTRGTTSGLTIGQLYEIRVRPLKVYNDKTVPGEWSPTVYRYFHTTQKIRLASKAKGEFTMSWENNPKATGYQVMFSTNRNGAGAAKNIYNVSAGSSSATIPDLKSGTTYYVQVREIHRVGSINYIGNISCPVAVKVR